MVDKFLDATRKADGESNFCHFLFEEYKNIASAHFNTIESISKFFRYYLIIMAAPFTTITLISQLPSIESSLLEFVSNYTTPIILVLIGIGFIGMGISAYIVNLRHDAILYARTINSIRKFFYDKSTYDHSMLLQIRCLPQSQRLPRYYEVAYFIPVVSILSILNTAYFLLALWAAGSFGWYLYFLLFALSLIFHLAGYYFISVYRERDYLRSNIMGIDIDGVISQHTVHFCKFLEIKVGKKLCPSQITTIPVHEIKNIHVSREDELQVFNDPKYWTDMPISQNASTVIAKLQNIFSLKIYIFSHRAWPEEEKAQETCKLVIKFIDKCKHKTLGCKLLRFFASSRRLQHLAIRYKNIAIHQLTKEWLKKHKIKPFKLYLEKGNDYSSDPKLHLRNRFYIAAKKKIRYFVEDDLNNAIKLAYICDTVFLIKQPYNSPDARKVFTSKRIVNNDLPTNIVIVDSWEDILRIMRQIS